MIGLCVAFILFVFFSKVLLRLLKFILQGAVGAVGFMLCNTALAAFGLTYAVGVNTLTVICVGILGIPGFLTLYALQWILH
jgi:inhibitor of the pro-sigma K processing machinery